MTQTNHQPHVEWDGGPLGPFGPYAGISIRMEIASRVFASMAQSVGGFQGAPWDKLAKEALAGADALLREYLKQRREAEKR